MTLLFAFIHRDIQSSKASFSFYDIYRKPDYDNEVLIIGIFAIIIQYHHRHMMDLTLVEMNCIRIQILITCSQMQLLSL